MKRNIIETVLGAIVLLVAAAFLVYGSQATEVGNVKGYEVTVKFNEIGGLKSGDDVRIGGVKIGSIEAIDLDPATYQARVTMSIRNDIKLPTDTAARVSSESLMGGVYLALDPGGNEDNVRPGGQLQYAQDAQNLEQLLGKFIFSMNNAKDKNAPASAQPQDQQQPTQAAPLPQM